ncbi:MAG: PP2C family protein-serine/threonine phosphatase [Nocardioidaceae bacterium]
MVLSLRYGAVSDIGRSRRKNDDSGYAGPHLLMVADGMGGAPAGDLASALAIQTARRLDVPPPDNLLEALAGALHRANERLADAIEEDDSADGMGTTVTAVLFDNDKIGVAHLGDSRGYLWRDGELLRISHDHSWVQSLIDEGRITEQEAATHSHRSLLLKVLDGRHDNEPDLTLYDVQAGDRLLLCSDGLSGFVDSERIARVMSIGNPQSVAAELTQLALESGSTDNVTVIVGDVVDGEPDGAEPIVVGAAADAHRGPLARLRTWAHRDGEDVGEILMEDPDIDPEELRYAPRPPRRYVWLKRAAVTVVVLALVVAGIVYAYRWTQEQYYVAAYDGHVAIYKGVQAGLPGISLSHVYQEQNLLLSQLPSFRRSQVVDGLRGGSLGSAHAIVGQLQGFADACARRQISSTTTTGAPTTTRRTTKRTTTHHTRRTHATSSAPSRSSTTGPRHTSRKSPRTASATTSAGRSQSTGAPDTDTGPQECSGATPLITSGTSQPTGTAR